MYRLKSAPQHTFLVENHIAGNLAHTHNDRVYVAAVAVNSVGLWSQPGYTDELVFDLLPPQLDFTGSGTGTVKGDAIVFNDPPFDVDFTIADDISPDISVTLTLTGPDPGLDVLDRTQPPFAPAWKPAGGYAFGYTFTAEAYGYYELYTRLEDKAGNVTESAHQLLRANKPPEVMFGDAFITNPARPITLLAEVTDADDTDQLFTYSWELTDYPYSQDGFDPAAAAPTATLLHRAFADQVSVYEVKLVVTDSDGKASQDYFTQVTVVNTSSGQLYTDEYWSGEHEVWGTVTIPADKTLLIADGATVKVWRDYDTGQGYYLEVDVGGTLSAGQGAVLRMMDGHQPYWKGVRVFGTVNLTGVTVKDAERAVIIAPGASAVIDGCRFEGNLIGTHLLNSGQAVTGCTFADNDEYGIKDDGGQPPVVTGNLFGGNTIDYYDPAGTRLTLEELNAIPGNENNDELGQ